MNLLSQRSVSSAKLSLGHGAITLVTDVEYDLCVRYLNNRALNHVAGMNLLKAFIEHFFENIVFAHLTNYLLNNIIRR